MMKSRRFRDRVVVTILEILLRRHSQASEPSPQPSPAGRGSQYRFDAQRMALEIRVHQTAGFHQLAQTPPS
jgi:hypothetical protein